jgi:hypothetical protein
MKYKRCVLIIGMLLIILLHLCLITASADPDPELNVGVFGASMMTGLRQAGFVISNDNEDFVATDIHYTFTVTGGFDDSIDYTMEGQKDELRSNQAFLFSTPSISGFGPVTLTITTVSSNAQDVTATRSGFQLGPYTMSTPYVLAWF